MSHQCSRCISIIAVSKEHVYSSLNQNIDRLLLSCDPSSVLRKNLRTSPRHDVLPRPHHGRLHVPRGRTRRNCRTWLDGMRGQTSSRRPWTRGLCPKCSGLDVSFHRRLPASSSPSLCRPLVPPLAPSCRASWSHGQSTWTCNAEVPGIRQELAVIS